VETAGPVPGRSVRRPQALALAAAVRRPARCACATYINGKCRLYPGGLITGSTTVPTLAAPQGTASTLFRGIQFGANGTQSPFNFGTTFASNCTGCSATEAGGTYQYFIAAEPYHNTHLVRIFELSADRQTSRRRSSSISARTPPRTWPIPKRFVGPIKVDNPYLDPVPRGTNDGQRHCQRQRCDQQCRRHPPMPRHAIRTWKNAGQQPGLPDRLYQGAS